MNDDSALDNSPAPDTETCLTKPDHYRTIYVYSAALENTAWMDAVQEPRIGQSFRQASGYGSQAYDFEGTPGVPTGALMSRPANMLECPPELFANFRFRKKIDFRLPDIFQLYGELLVSEKFKEALEALDPDGGHYFIPTMFFGKNGETVTDQQYYLFFCGRMTILLEDKNRQALYRGEPVYKGLHSSIFDTQERARFLAKLPVWMREGITSTVFFSQDIFDGLQSYDLYGLAEFSVPGGKYSRSKHKWPETVAQIWVGMGPTH